MRNIKELLIILKNIIEESNSMSILNALLTLSAFNKINNDEFEFVLNSIWKEVLEEKSSLNDTFEYQKNLAIMFIEYEEKKESLKWLNKHIDKL